MTKRSKAYRAAAEKIQSGVLYTPAEAIHLAKSTSITKFDATVDVVFRLGVDPRKADQMVRGTVSLPHGTGKTARVVVFAQGERAEQALAEVGCPSIIVTHDPADVAALADDVAVLDNGRIVEHGPAAEVMARPESSFGKLLFTQK